MGDGFRRVEVRQSFREGAHGLHHLLVVAQPLADFNVFGPRAVKDLL